MLIYHITDNQLYCTEVLMGGISKSNIHHFKKSSPDDCWEVHRDGVSELRNNGKIFVTGGTYVGAIYEGKFEDRAGFHHYIGNIETLKGE